MSWQRFLRNPTVKLGAGRPPKGISRAMRQDLLGTSWDKGLKPLSNGVLGAAVYGDSVIAKREMRLKKTRKLFQSGLKKVGYEGDFDMKVMVNSIIATDKAKSSKSFEVFSKNGSPYFKSEPVQDKKSDEGETMMLECRITGAKDRIEGRRAGATRLPEVVITVPHMHDDGINDGHDTDFKSREAAMRIGNQLKRHRIDATMIQGDVNRDDVDLNREESQFTEFHLALDEVLEESPDILLDIHSYPEGFPVWTDYDVVLFANGPLHDDDDNEDSLNLAKYIQAKAPGTKVLIDTADYRRHYIQNKGLMRNIESHLVEFNESTNTKMAELAVGDYAAGIKANPPTSLPPGVKWQQVSMRIGLGKRKDGTEKRISSLEMLELELEERGFVKARQSFVGPIVNTMTFAIPETVGKPGPVISAQRYQRSVVLRNAQALTNDDIILLQTLLHESSNTQPRLNPVDNVEALLEEKGVPERFWKGVVGLIDQGNKQKLKDYRNKNFEGKLSNKDIDNLIGGGAKAEFSDKNSDEELEKALEAQGKSIPKTKDGNINRAEAIKQLNKQTKVATKGLDTFTKAKKKEMKLSTSVTQMILSNLIPGTGRRKKEQEGKKGKGNQKTKGGQVDAEKVKNLREFKSLRDSQKELYFPKQGSPNWNEIKKKFGSKDIFKKNPPVKAIPSAGQFTMNVTNQIVKGAKITVTNQGKDSRLSVGRIESPPSGKLDKSLGKIVRVNMFRRKAGFKIKHAVNQPDYIISVETGGKHYYAKNEVVVDGYAMLRHFPNKKSEPRLRVESRGNLELYGKEHTLVVRGKEHPLYDKIIVHHEGRMKNNPGTKSAYALDYIDDHKLMNPTEEKRKFKRMKLKGPVGSDAFFEQIASKMQVFGEGQGWVRDGYLYWRKGPGHQNYVNVDGHMLKGGTAWMHTHPAAWEPSQTSPDDFKVMHGLFINHGVQDSFTIIADRIDWFHFAKKDRLKVDEMVEHIEEFETEIMDEFAKAESDFQDKMGDKPFLTLEQTRYITEHLNKTIPEFSVRYQAYVLSPQQINEIIKRNPPSTVPIHGLY